MREPSESDSGRPESEPPANLFGRLRAALVDEERAAVRLMMLRLRRQCPGVERTLRALVESRGAREGDRPILPPSEFVAAHSEREGVGPEQIRQRLARALRWLETEVVEHPRLGGERGNGIAGSGPRDPSSWRSVARWLRDTAPELERAEPLSSSFEEVLEGLGELLEDCAGRDAPSPTSELDFTELLDRSRAGDDQAVEELFVAVYDALHQLARAHMDEQPRGHTLQPTALINEAYLRLVSSRKRDWVDRAHFLRAAGSAMRTALIDHARAKGRIKRGSEHQRVPMESLRLEFEARSFDLLALDDALEQLGEIDTELVRVVELRFFSGCTTTETAAVLDISERKAQRDWQFARRWLYQQLRDR